MEGEGRRDLASPAFLLQGEGGTSGGIERARASGDNGDIRQYGRYSSRRRVLGRPINNGPHAAGDKIQ